MPLITPLDLAAYQLTPEPPYFREHFAGELDSIDSIDSSLATIADVSTGLDIAGALASLDGPISIVESALGFAGNDTGAGEIAGIAGAATSIDKGIGAATSGINSAADKGGLIGINIPPIGGINVSPPTPGQPPAQPPPTLPPVLGTGGVGPPATGFHLQFTNTTRPGAPGRPKVGESYSLVITGKLGTSIYVVSTHDGRELPQAGFGVVPASGKLTITGSFSASDKGAWIENWYAQGNYIGQVAFTVE